MSTLHSLHHANSHALQRAIAAAQPGDALLLREDAVLLARSEAIARKSFSACYAIQADIEARGLNALLTSATQAISDAEFVALTLQHDRVIAWR